MEKLLSQYQLRQHPFDEDMVIRPIDDETHQHLWFPLGERARIQEICGTIQNAASKGKPHMVLVHGRSGFGVTSAAHYLMYTYMVGSNVDAGRFLFNAKELKNENAGEHLPGLITDAIQEVEGKKIDIDLKLRDQLWQFVQSQPSSFNPGFFRLLMSGLAKALREKQAGCGYIIEGVTSKEALQTILDAFNKVPCLVVLTVGDYADDRKPIIRAFLENGIDCNHILTLDSVRPSDIIPIATQRWSACAKPISIALPFGSEGIVDAFGEKDRPLKKVIQLLRAALEWHCERAEYGGTWPEDKALYIHSTELVASVKFIERLIFKRRHE